MEFSLDIPRGDAQRAFMDYLNAALRRDSGSRSGRAETTESGELQIAVSGPLKLGELTMKLNWVLTKSVDGTLRKLSVDCEDPATVDKAWERAVSELVVSVLANAFSQNRRKYFRRLVFHYFGAHLDGEYWLPGYRFAPALPYDPMPVLFNAERPVCIDQHVMAVDDTHASLLAEERARRIAARLSLLLNTGIQPPDHLQRWVWPVVDGIPAPESIRYQTGFNHPRLQVTEMPQKGEVCHPGKYAGSLTNRYRFASELLSLPREARKILRGVDEASPIVSDAFDRSARLYQVATVCERQFPSVGLAYRVAAVEAASKGAPEAIGFGSFMRRYVKSQAEIKEIIDYLHGDVRSAHFHAGQFPMGEYGRRHAFDVFMDSDEVQLDSLHRTCYEMTREAIVNWLIEFIPDRNGDSDDGENVGSMARPPERA